MQVPANRWQVSGRLIGRDALRFTPAGIALLNGRMVHRSEQTEAAAKRSVEFEIDLLFAGELAVSAQRLMLGEGLDASGFLAPRRKLSRTLILHVTDFKPNPTLTETSTINSN